MEHQLNILVGNSHDHAGHPLLRQIHLTAEIGLEERPIGFPDSFGGKLLGATPELLLEIATNDFAEVGFLGKRYKFTKLEQDGSFEVRKDW